MKNNLTKTWFHTFLLTMTAMIWGFGFVAQRIGADSLPPMAFLCGRSLLSFLTILPVYIVYERYTRSRYGFKPIEQEKQEKRLTVKAGMICGIALFVGSAAQQIGITHTTSAKAGFITALYVIIVPLLSVLKGKAPAKRIWVAVALSLCGLYLLCFFGDASFGFGELMMLVGALSFSVQIIAISYYGSSVNGVGLSLAQAGAETILALLGTLFFEQFTWQNVVSALPALLYAGSISGGIAYTLQIVGQKDLDPTIASLTMCLESVFSALAGWLVLNQSLTIREIIGGALMFAAIVLASLPDKTKKILYES